MNCRQTYSKVSGFGAIRSPLPVVCSVISFREIINTNKFDFVRAASGPGWLQSLHEMTLQTTGMEGSPGSVNEVVDTIPAMVSKLSINELSANLLQESARDDTTDDRQR
jgi:hypothetical protein